MIKFIFVQVYSIIIIKYLCACAWCASNLLHFSHADWQTPPHANRVYLMDQLQFRLNLCQTMTSISKPTLLPNPINRMTERQRNRKKSSSGLVKNYAWILTPERVIISHNDIPYSQCFESGHNESKLKWKWIEAGNEQHKEPTHASSPASTYARAQNIKGEMHI